MSETEMIYDCCIHMIKLLDRMLEQNQISRDEYDDHIKLKKEFLSKFLPGKIGSSVG